MQGRIYKALSGFYYIKAENNKIYQTRARGKFRKSKFSPLVGDIVEFESANDKEGIIKNVQKRKNQLQRPTVANVDQVIIVTSMADPNFSSNLLDRFIVMVESLKIKPIIYISKVDLFNNKEELENIVSLYTSLDYKVFLSNQDKEELKKIFKNKLTVVMGQSGAGKSTLLNELLGKKQLEVGEISKALGRGRHTTRHTELLEINEGLLADTPGFSALEFQNITEQELSDYFPEIRALKNNCKFRGCLHLHEPKCAVKEAVQNKEINEERYQNYLQFLEEIKNNNQY